MFHKKPVHILLMLLTMTALLAFAASASAQESTPTAPTNPVPASHRLPPPGAPNNAAPTGTPEAPQDDHGQQLPDGQRGHHPPRPPQTYTASTSVTCAPATRLEGAAQGEVAQSYSSIRESIGSSVVLAVMPSGAVFDILDGPVCSGPHYWYQVSYNGIVGWVAEGNLTEYWLEPVSQ